MSDLVTISQHPLPYVLVTPRPTPARTGPNFQRMCSWQDIEDVIRQCMDSRILAFDWETKGTEAYKEDNYPVGLGLAWDTGSCYFNIRELSNTDADKLYDLLLNHPATTAYNVYFDGSWIYNKTGRHGNYIACTYGLNRHITTEQFRGQQWGLKHAMTNILQWESANTTELDIWLISQEFITSQRPKDMTAENMRQFYLEGRVRPDHSLMYLAPPHILGQYCILDAEATYLLYTEHLEPICRKFPALQEYHGRYFLGLVLTLIEQRSHGILIDRQKMEQYQIKLTEDRAQAERSFYDHTKIAPILEEYRALRVQEHLARKPEAKWIKKPERKEPARYTVTGAESKNWLKWRQMEDEYVPRVRADYAKWELKLAAIQQDQDEDNLFSVRSDLDMRWLLYDKLKFPLYFTTETGLPQCGDDALSLMGDVGQLVIKYNTIQKELEYIESYLELLDENSILHPRFNTPGTVSGRLSGGEPNLQQVPKTRGTLECFIPRPGYVFVDCDVTALEDYVMCELSGDPGLMHVYGPGAPLNDRYLLVGHKLPAIGESIVAAGYKPDVLNKQQLSDIKKQVKHERNIAKTIVLACIAEDTVIRVKGHGYKKIQDIEYWDAVWDGADWVCTDGAVDKGIRSCIIMEQVSITPDHLILGEDNEWKPAQEYRQVQTRNNTPQPKRPKKPSASWSEVWKVFSNIIRGYYR